MSNLNSQFALGPKFAVPLESEFAVWLRTRICNKSIHIKPKKHHLQVALDVLSLTPFYLAFLITASIPAVYMHEFWATASYHKHSIRFKLNIKSYSFDLDTFRNMLQINIKLFSDVKVDILPQPWRTFGTIINKCLSGKVTGIDTLRLSRAQILWGLYHQKKVDYVYLLWEDLVFQIENKESRKNKYMFYPRFTKVIINHFMSQDQSIPRRNKVDWHMANDDPILTTMRFIPQHEVFQKYGAILLDNLTTQTMKESEAYKTYYAFATRKAIPKPKYFDESNTYVLERFDTSAGNPVKEILLKLNLPDHRSILTDSKEYIKMDMERRSVKVKELREICIITAFKLSNQEWYEHVGQKTTSSQDGKVYKMAKRDYAWLMISSCSRSHFSQTSQDKGTSSSLKSNITTTIHKFKIEVKDYELKTKVKA
ncbi:hypothetical protein Tco_0802218 [Tanacetum coccineum]|uniref:Uncharacterized protein n=1 Tax=Tanacetum coccineum TaxID=301880 RepID=A0ABQ4ZY66_9ASTR